MSRRRLPLRLPAVIAQGDQQWLIGSWVVFQQASGIWCALADDGEDETANPPLFAETLDSLRWLIAAWDKTLLVREARAASRIGRATTGLEHRAGLLEDLIDAVGHLAVDTGAVEQQQQVMRQRIAVASATEQGRREDLYKRIAAKRHADLNAKIDAELAKVRQRPMVAA